MSIFGDALWPVDKLSFIYEMAHEQFNVLQVLEKQGYVWMVKRVQMNYVTSGVDVTSVGLTYM